MRRSFWRSHCPAPCWPPRCRQRETCPRRVKRSAILPSRIPARRYLPMRDRIQNHSPAQDRIQLPSRPRVSPIRARQDPDSPIRDRRSHPGRPPLCRMAPVSPGRSAGTALSLRRRAYRQNRKIFQAPLFRRKAGRATSRVNFPGTASPEWKGFPVKVRNPVWRAMAKFPPRKKVWTRAS